MRCERQKHPEAEDLQRMLAADYRRSQPGTLEYRPFSRNEPHRDDRQREEMHKAQNVKIGLVDRVHPVRHPLRYEIAGAREIPGHDDREREKQEGEPHTHKQNTTPTKDDDTKTRPAP